jgi:hypothetical protein
MSLLSHCLSIPPRHIANQRLMLTPSCACSANRLRYKRDIDRWHEPARCQAIKEWTRWNNLLCQPDAGTPDLTGIERVGQRRRADRSRIGLSVSAQADANRTTASLDLDDEAIPVVTSIALLQPTNQTVEPLARPGSST